MVVPACMCMILQVLWMRRKLRKDYWDGGATFDTETGARLALGDICTDMGELARIVASLLYAEDASQFSISEAEMAQKIAANEVSPDNVDSWFCRCLLLQV